METASCVGSDHNADGSHTQTGQTLPYEYVLMKAIGGDARLCLGFTLTSVEGGVVTYSRAWFQRRGGRKRSQNMAAL